MPANTLPGLWVALRDLRDSRGRSVFRGTVLRHAGGDTYTTTDARRVVAGPNALRRLAAMPAPGELPLLDRVHALAGHVEDAIARVPLDAVQRRATAAELVRLAARLTGGIGPQPDVPEFVIACCACASMRLQVSTWWDPNRNEAIGDDGPTDQNWCPRCLDDDAAAEAIYRSDADPMLWRCNRTNADVSLRDALRNMMHAHTGERTRPGRPNA